MDKQTDGQTNGRTDKRTDSRDTLSFAEHLKTGNSPLRIKEDSGLCRSMFILCRSIFCLGKVQGKNVRLHLSKKYESSSDEKRMVTEIDIFSNFLELLL